MIVDRHSWSCRPSLGFRNDHHGPIEDLQSSTKQERVQKRVSVSVIWKIFKEDREWRSKDYQKETKIYKLNKNL